MMNENELLKILNDSDTLEPSALAEQIKKIMTIKQLKKEYPEDSLKRHPDGRYYKRIDKKFISAITYDSFIEKVYEMYHGKKIYTFASIFPDWQKYRRDIEKVSSRTLEDHNGYWRNYMADSKLVKIPLEKVTVKDIKDFYTITLTNNDISSGTFSFLKTILNKLYDYAIAELELPLLNPISSISMTPYKNSFKEDRDTSDDVYKKADRAILLRYLESIEPDVYSLATQLAFRLIVRIGELKALRWSDIDGNYINIRHQTVEDRKMNDDLTFEPRTMKTINRMKGKSKNGKRKQYLTADAREILKQMKELNPDGEYIFLQPNGNQLNTKTFNTHLERFCKEAGVEYHSSHKIRFTSASMLYKGHNLATLSKLLGHTTTNMTLHYFRNILGDDEVEALMSELDILEVV